MRIHPNVAMLLSFAIVIFFYFTTFRGHPGTPWLVYPIAAGLLAPFILGPIHIHKTHWVNLEPTLKPFDPRGPESSPEASRYLDAVEGDLARLGFALVRSYSIADLVANARGSTTLFQNRNTSETIRMISAVGESGVVRQATVLLLITTEFSDGTEVVTTNSRQPSAYPRRPPPFHVFVLPDVRAADHLLAAHRALVRRFEAGRTRVDAIGGDPDGYLQDREFRRSWAHQVACGYFYADDWQRVLRPTWKGAILMTWKLAWPVKPIRLALRRVRARRLLRELEAEGLEI